MNIVVSIFVTPFFPTILAERIRRNGTGLILGSFRCGVRVGLMRVTNVLIGTFEPVYQTIY